LPFVVCGNGIFFISITLLFNLTVNLRFVKQVTSLGGSEERQWEIKTAEWENNAQEYYSFNPIA
jgi:hypothetical protein